MTRFEWSCVLFLFFVCAKAPAAEPALGAPASSDPIAARWSAWGGDKERLPVDIKGDGNVIVGRRKLWATRSLPALSYELPFAFQRIDRVGLDQYRETWTAHTGAVVLTRRFVQPKMRAFIPALGTPVGESRTFTLEGHPQSISQYDRDGHLIRHQIFSSTGRPLVTKTHRPMELSIEIHDANLRGALQACPEGLERNFTGPSARRGLHPRWSEYDAPLRFYCGSDGVHDSGQELFVSLQGRVRAERVVQIQNGLLATRRVDLKVWDQNGEVVLQAKTRWGIGGPGSCRVGQPTASLEGMVAQDPVTTQLSASGPWHLAGSKEHSQPGGDGGTDAHADEAPTCFKMAESLLDVRVRPEAALTSHLIP